jgi:hypothetical protein
MISLPFPARRGKKKARALIVRQPAVAACTVVSPFDKRNPLAALHAVGLGK